MGGVLSVATGMQSWFESPEIAAPAPGGADAGYASWFDIGGPRRSAASVRRWRGRDLRPPWPELKIGAHQKAALGARLVLYAVAFAAGLKTAAHR